MSAPVCYVERIGRGTLIRRVRIVGDKLDAVWTPPSSALVAGEGSAPDPTSVVEQTRSAARWVAQQLPRSRALSAVCLDSDGASCLWLSAPSADPGVVAAALTTGREPAGDAESAGPGGLAQMLAAGAGMERSVQALAEPGRAAKTPGAADAAGGRRRMAVLSVPDLTVRVFLDELDAQGVAVNAVSTLWHALAASWDPAARTGGADEAPCTAVVMLDPDGADADSPAAPGRLVWAWAAGGELLAGGSMRLRAHAPAAPAPGAAAPDLVDEPGADGGTALRRLPAPDTAENGERTLTCGRADAGRLTADWLAWSAQLGLGPSRIICVGPVPEPEEPDADAGLAALLSRSWQGASIDAAVHPDPVGATLDRFRGREEDDIAASDPREALLELSGRPGRAHRRMYRWAAAAVASLAAVAAVAGFCLSRAAAGVRGQADKAASDLKTTLTGLDSEVPQISSFPGGPVALLMSKIQEIRGSQPTLEYERPTLAELARLIEAIGAEGVHPELRIEELSINLTGGTARLSSPESDLISGEIIRNTLAQTPGELTWRSNSTSPAAGQTTRTWNLDGTWNEARRSGRRGR